MYNKLADQEGPSPGAYDDDVPAYPNISQVSQQSTLQKAAKPNSNQQQHQHQHQHQTNTIIPISNNDEYDNDPEDIDAQPGQLGQLGKEGLNGSKNGGYISIAPDCGCFLNTIYSILWYFMMGFPCAILSTIGLITIAITVWIFNPCHGTQILSHVKSIVIAEWNPRIVCYRYVIHEKDSGKDRFCIQYSNILFVILSCFVGIIHLFIAIGLMCTIIFIPVGMMHYNLAQITLFPFHVELFILPRDGKATGGQFVSSNKPTPGN